MAENVTTPAPTTFAEKVRSNAQFLRDCYASLTQAEAEAIAKKLDQCANRLAASETAFAPTHQHAEGGLYRAIGAGKIQWDGLWYEAVIYENEEGMQFARRATDFARRFTSIAAPQVGEGSTAGPAAMNGEPAAAASVPSSAAPSPHGGLTEIIAEYDRIVNGRLDPRDAEADFVMRGSDWREIRKALQSANALTFSQLAGANLRRATKWHEGGLDEWSVADWATAMAGEAGEICNAVKKLRRIEDEIANISEPDRQLSTRQDALKKIGEEIADTLIYLDLLAQRIGVNLADAVVEKYNAVSVKYGFPDRL